LRGAQEGSSDQPPQVKEWKGHAEIETITVDDIDGTEGVEPVLFGIDGKALVIDLKPAYAGRYRGVDRIYVS
jgi:hypothetical protein